MEKFKNRVMNRINWFIHLRVIFENSVRTPDNKECVVKSDFLKQFKALQNVSVLAQ